MDILKIAIQSGLLITLDGRIGRQEYRSVYGSIQALQRFADALLTPGEQTDVQRPDLDTNPYCNEPILRPPTRSVP
jgi:hypothetical protein